MGVETYMQAAIAPLKLRDVLGMIVGVLTYG